MKHNINIRRHEKFGLPAKSYVYRDADGAPVLVANRYERADGGKFFLPYDVLRGEWKAPERRVIYNLDLITKADPKTPTIMVEGEKCADRVGLPDHNHIWRFQRGYQVRFITAI